MKGIQETQEPLSTPLSEADVRQITAEGLQVEGVLAQIALFRKGITPVFLKKPCVLGDGIDIIPQENKASLVSLCDEETGRGRIMKFVPASGAASRMFKDWYDLLEENGMEDKKAKHQFCHDLPRFAFYDDLQTLALRNGQSIDALLRDGRLKEVLGYILTPAGLNYGHLPKGLLKFHQYREGNRTALEEHLVEAALYACDADRLCRLHLTISAEHRTAVEACLRKVREPYERLYGVKYDIQLSVQQSATNTIAVDIDNHPFRDEKGMLIFRPGGHGALLENLNSLGGDIIFLKNIDNVIPDRIKDATVLYKKILCGYLVSLQRNIFRFQQKLHEGAVREQDVEEMTIFCGQRLHLVFSPEFQGLPLLERATLLFERLHRPIRVCGMVRNEGEPGGGPFWVEEKDGTQSLQIVEEFQIDHRVATQKAIWLSATHFNPVDLVCGIRDFQGRKFDLHQYVNPGAVSISRKTEKGRDLKALELPGLWNGSMAYWITVFIEVPVETFNPVKTICDLLRDQHLP